MLETKIITCPNESCRVKFTGTDQTKRCPKCGTKLNSSSQADSFMDIIKRNGLISLVVLLSIIGFIVWFLVSGDNKSSENQKYYLSFVQNDNFIEIVIADSLGNKFEYRSNPQLYDTTGFIVSPQDLYATKENKIYGCKNGSLTITWQKGEFYKTDNNRLWQQNQQMMDFILADGAEPDRIVDCDDPLLINVESDNKCGIIIRHNKGDKVVLFSVTGKDGLYEDKKIWKFDKNNYEYDVWGKLKDTENAVAAIAGVGQAQGCHRIEPKEVEQLVKNLVSGTNEKFRDHFHEFSTKISPTAKFVINGKENNIQALGIELKTAINSEQKVSYQIKFNADKSAVEQITFTTQ